MINRTVKTVARGFLPALLLTLGLCSVSWGAEFWLRAETLTKTMPDASVITMWGFAQCTDGTYASCGQATVPGPRLTVPVGDTVLTVNLRNNLTGPLVEPVSIVIPGQTAASMTPVRNLDGRVRSFTAETPANNSTTVTYSWPALKPGTYLYQSGTHPAVQVQMGLYGAVTKDFAAGQAYGPTTAFASEALLLFSEIDPALHAAVAGGTYGTAAYPSTFNYEPKYFLINGAPYSASSVPIPAGNAGSNILLRFLNAGLKSHVPVTQGLTMSIVAEDGNTYVFAKQQYSLLLPAGKTTDAIITPATIGTYAIYDRRLALTNGALSGGGMLVNIGVGPGTASIAEKIGVFQQGTWYLDASGNSAWNGAPPDSLYAFGVGIPGALPATGDWNGSGTSKVGVFTGGTWYVDMNGNGAWDGTPTDSIYAFGVGIPGALPIAGDWNGSGTSKIGIYANNTWWIDFNGNGSWDGTPTDRTYVFGTGLTGAVPVTGDWTGTGTTKIGVYVDGTWYLDLNGNGAWDGTPTDGTYTFGTGLTGAVPVTGDWNGSGTSKSGVYVDGTWYLDLNGNGAWDGTPTDGIYAFGAGLAGASPVSGKW